MLAISTDLMLASRVEEALGAAGHEVVTASAPAEAQLDGVDLAVPRSRMARELPALVDGLLAA